MKSARAASVFAVFSLWLYGAGEACTSHVPEYALVDGGEGGATEDAPGGPLDAEADATPDQSAEAPPSVPMTHVRFALFAPDMPSAVDFCIAPFAPSADAGDAAPSEEAGDGSAPPTEPNAGEPVWQGPLVGQASTDVDGGVGLFTDGAVPGVTFPQVTRYFEVPAGAYLLRTVAAGSSDCGLPLLSADAMLPVLAVNASSTVALVGDYQQAASDAVIAVETFTDDTSAASGKIALRFVSAVPSAALVSLGTGAAGSPGYRSLFVGVPFGDTGGASDTDAGKVDPGGYVSIAPLADTSFTVTDPDAIDAGGPLVFTEGVSIASGSVVTFAAVGGKTGGPAPELVLCRDTAAAIGVVFADCDVLATPPGD